MVAYVAPEELLSERREAPVILAAYPDSSGHPFYHLSARNIALFA